jgi:hypothetical protein
MTRCLLPLACLAFTFTISTAFAGDCTDTRPATGELVGKGLLSPDISDAERYALGTQLICSALAGNGKSQEIAGSLYRWGPRHPAHVFPEDHDRARDLLTAAASQGYRGAMLKLAELELADGHAHEALLWAQIEGVFYRRTTERSDSDGELVPSLRYATYFAMLIKRVSAANGPYDETVLSREIDVRVDGIDQQMAAHPRPHGPAFGKGKLPSQQHIHDTSPTDRDQGAYAQFFVEVSPDGRVTRDWLVDAYPDPGAGLRLGRMVPQIRWDSLPAGDATMRYGLLPVSMSSGWNRTNPTSK